MALSDVVTLPKSSMHQLAHKRSSLAWSERCKEWKGSMHVDDGLGHTPGDLHAADR